MTIVEQLMEASAVLASHLRPRSFCVLSFRPTWQTTLEPLRSMAKTYAPQLSCTHSYQEAWFPPEVGRRTN